MVNDDERREVARRLRGLPDDSTYPDLIGAIADHDGWYAAADAADRLADLIDPDTTTDTTKTPELTTKCDRDALLALADEMEFDGAGALDDEDWCKPLLVEYARRIREALGEVD